ncbi:SCRN2 family protein [Megaselia abdita]
MSSQILIFKFQETILFARNTLVDQETCHEVKFYQKSEDGQVKTDGGLELSCPIKSSFIIQRLAEHEFGGDFGANENNVVVAVSWASKAATNYKLKPTDIVRLVLGGACVDSESGVKEIGKLIEEYGSTDTKLNFVVACPKDVWIVSVAGKCWAATKLGEDLCVELGGDGLEVTTKIDLSTDGLKDKIEWDKNEPFNFGKAFDSIATQKKWTGIECSSKAEGIINMFDNMRQLSKDLMTGSCSLAVLDSKELSCFWFTATPNLKQSVFKPFFFCGENTRISPLTQVPDGETITLLHKLHSQRKWEAIGNLLIGLEKYCVGEVMSYSANHGKITEDVFELLKDCVEAEAKFYR